MEFFYLPLKQGCPTSKHPGAVYPAGHTSDGHTLHEPHQGEPWAPRPHGLPHCKWSDKGSNDWAGVWGLHLTPCGLHVVQGPPVGQPCPKGK